MAFRVIYWVFWVLWEKFKLLKILFKLGSIFYTKFFWSIFNKLNKYIEIIISVKKTLRKSKDYDHEYKSFFWRWAFLANILVRKENDDSENY